MKQIFSYYLTMTNTTDNNSVTNSIFIKVKTNYTTWSACTSDSDTFLWTIRGFFSLYVSLLTYQLVVLPSNTKMHGFMIAPMASIPIWCEPGKIYSSRSKFIREIRHVVVSLSKTEPLVRVSKLNNKKTCIMCSLILKISIAESISKLGATKSSSFHL